MQYFGGKVKIAKDLSLFLNQYIKENNFKNFVDMFCGSCNISSKINIEGTRYANDKHSYLIAMWESLQKGWIPPTVLTKEEYNFIKDNKDFNYIMYGLDADLIFLTLSTGLKNTFLLREAQQFNKNADKNKLNMVSINIMRQSIFEKIKIYKIIIINKKPKSPCSDKSST